MLLPTQALTASSAPTSHYQALSQLLPAGGAPDHSACQAEARQYSAGWAVGGHPFGPVIHTAGPGNALWKLAWQLRSIPRRLWVWGDSHWSVSAAAAAAFTAAAAVVPGPSHCAHGAPTATAWPDGATWAAAPRGESYNSCIIQLCQYVIMAHSVPPLLLEAACCPSSCPHKLSPCLRAAPSTFSSGAGGAVAGRQGQHAAARDGAAATATPVPAHATANATARALPAPATPHARPATAPARHAAAAIPSAATLRCQWAPIPPVTAAHAWRPA